MLNKDQRDAITEIVNIGVGKGSATLSEMVQTEIVLNVPYVNVVAFKDLFIEFDQIETGVIHASELKLFGEYEGISNIILSEESAEKLASAITNEPVKSTSLQEMKDGILIEVGNIILNAVMGSFGNILDVPLDYKIPQSFNGDIASFYNHLDEAKYNQVLLCRTNFTVEGKAIEGEILIIYEINSFKKLQLLLNSMINS